MNTEICNVSFPQTNYQPICLSKNENISEYLTVQNSPVLFGCRTGICGTCIVVVNGDIPPPTEEEKEILEIFAPENSQVRLACQLKLTSDIEITLLKGDLSGKL
ncbi:MAG: (2Fe-2S)-binding protein [Scytonematopsis contorta HA4267-MV1]|jgi:ferredoxin|nr:(2Fe-2S)-binding protein [Scytonematopsis contorta HA4267-MV1]